METKDFNYLSQKNIESFSFEFDIQLYDVEEYYYTTLYKVIFRIKSKCGEWNYQEDGDFEEYFKQTFFQLTHDEDTTSQYYYWSDKSSEFKPVIDLDWEIINRLIYRHLREDKYAILKRRNYATIKEKVKLKYKNADALV